MTEINKKIQRYTFCAVIEVTNGVSKHRLQEKVEQALNGKQHVQENNPFTNVYSGLIFYRNANVANLNTAPLDFVLQIPQYERGTLIEAVIAAQSRQTDAQNKYIARALRSLIKRNVNINTLLYPNKRTWPTLTEDFGSLAGDRTLKEYHARIADVKGAMLEEYVKIILGVIPTVEGPITTPTGDIDIIVAGPEELVLGRLNNPHYFIRHKKPETVPK